MFTGLNKDSLYDCVIKKIFKKKEKKISMVCYAFQDGGSNNDAFTYIPYRQSLQTIHSRMM